MSLTELSLAFVNTRDLWRVQLLGQQRLSRLLKISTLQIPRLVTELLREINKIHEEVPNPSP